MKPGKTVDAVVRALRSMMLTGSYRRGAALPSAREIAVQLGVNKNTVSKAFAALARDGLVRVSPGRRATVHGGRDAAQPMADVLRRRMQDALTPVLREARLLGAAREVVAGAAAAAITAFYDTSTPAITLVECNALDARQYATELSGLLGVPVRWRLLDALGDVSPSDVLVVPYYHLDDVAGGTAKAQVVGVHIAPDPDVLLRLLQAAQRADEVGLVCGNAAAAKRYARLLEFYTARRLRIVHYRDGRAAARVLAECRDVFVTPEARAALRTRRRTGLVEFAERIDPQSLGPLRLMIRGAD